MRLGCNRLSVALLFLLSACVTGKGVVNIARDPWNGKYQHISGKFDLILDRISKEFVEVDIFELPRSNVQRAKTSFVADVKDDKAIFQAGRGEKCRVELQIVDRGVMISDFCNGTGEDVGLYRQIEGNSK
jgi:hypothetical protein